MPNQQRRKSSEKPSAILRDGQAAGIGGDDGSRFADGIDFAQQFAFEFEVLDDGFDDPVNFGELLEVVLEVADGDQAIERRLEEGGGFRLDRGFYCRRRRYLLRAGPSASGGTMSNR